MEEIYLFSHFDFNGIKSYHLPLCGLSLVERLQQKYPNATLFFEQKRGKDGEELLGISLKNLSEYPLVCRRLSEEILINLLRRGVLIEDLETVYIEEGVQIEKGAVIRRGSYIESGCFIGSGSKIGPYAYLRKNSKIGRNCRVGDFCEMKNASLGDNGKTSHLSYLGDCDVGKNCNIGCGVVFVNYDGRKKQRIEVGDDCFIGSNCNLVAPLKVGKGAYLACGSTLTKNLESGDFCIARSRETVKAGRAKEYYKPKE